MKKRAIVVLAAALCVAAIAVYLRYGRRVAQQDRVIGPVVTIRPPLGLPAVPVPAGDPVTAQKIALGRRLFYDTQLSSDNSLSCASCHSPVLGFTDGKMHSTGVGGKTGTRNAPSVLNAAYDPVQFWDGRAPTLEAQVVTPMTNPVEMNQPHTIAVSKLQKDASYREQFQAAFGPGPVTIGRIEKAIASFERILISGNSPFDRYQFGGDRTALSPAAIRGLAVFTDPKRGNCAACHTINHNYALFTDGKFHNTGAGVNGEGELTDLGRYNETKIEADKGAFKTPSLRNVAQSAPYMHDGSLKTLRDVVDFYAGGGNSNPYLDKEMKASALSEGERSDLVEFLKSLSGELPANAGPPANAKMKP
jgi:cytochrome c peroxidase